MKTVLYVGLEAPVRNDVEVIHCPLIEVVPRPSPEIEKAFDVSHIIVTSKSTVRCFTALQLPPRFYQKQFLSVGKATTRALMNAGATHVHTASNESQEGILELISQLNLSSSTFFWGHSNLSRPLLKEQLGARLKECILYDTHFKEPAIQLDLSKIDEIHFSSPSCVDAFIHFFATIPPSIQISTQGEITKSWLLQKAGDVDNDLRINKEMPDGTTRKTTPTAL